MVKTTKSSSNIFARFFNIEEYVALKNKLFNYRFRKYMLSKAYYKNQNLNQSSNPKILDVGCGISPISPLPDKTIFIDSDEDAINILNKKKYMALKGDVSHIPFANKTIDYIFCSEVLEHVPNPKNAMIEFGRVLRNKGLLFLTVPTHMHYWSFDDEYVGHLRRFDPNHLAKELSASGFKIIEIKPIGSFIERAITKMLVKRAMKQNESRKKINSMTLKAFGFINKIFFALTYLGYLLNTKNSSSVVLIVAQKKI